WLFYLEALDKGLTEKTETVEQTITSHEGVLGNSRIQEASGEAAQATIAQCCVIFDLQDVGELMAQLTGSSCSLINETYVGQVVQQCTAHEEFSGEIMLLASSTISFAGALPII